MFNELTEALKAEDIAATVAVTHEQDVHDAMSEQEEVEELATVFDELDNADLFNSDIHDDIDATSDALDIEDDSDDDGDLEIEQYKTPIRATYTDVSKWKPFSMKISRTKTLL